MTYEDASKTAGTIVAQFRENPDAPPGFISLITIATEGVAEAVCRQLTVEDIIKLETAAMASFNPFGTFNTGEEKANSSGRDIFKFLSLATDYREYKEDPEKITRLLEAANDRIGKKPKTELSQYDGTPKRAIQPIPTSERERS